MTTFPGNGYTGYQRILGQVQAFHCRCVLEVKTVDGLKKSVDFLQKPGLFGENSMFRRIDAAGKMEYNKFI